MTTQRQRFLAAAHGAETDRPPVGGWIHHGSSFWSPLEVAEAHLRYARHYDWDYIKVMNDYRLELPEGLKEITSAEQFDLIAPDPAILPDNLKKQAEVLRIIRAAEPDRAVIETIFSPNQNLVRALGNQVIEYFRHDPELAHRTNARVTQQLINYVKTLSKIGVDAVFLAVNGTSKDETSWGLKAEDFRDWIAPYDKQVLEAAAPLVRIAHLHGEEANPELIRDYPVEVLSWADRDSEPKIGEARSRFGWIPMIGIDEIHSLNWTPTEVTEHVLSARKQAKDKIIIAPNCTLHSDESPLALEALRKSVELQLTAA